MNAPQKPVLGAALMIVATSLIAASLVCAKMLGTGETPIPAMQIAWGRFAFALPLVLVAIAAHRPTFIKPKTGLHAMRICAGMVGVTLMFAATGYIPLSDTTAISFTNPIIAMLLAIPILHEKIGPVRWSTAALAFFGAFLLIRPGMSSFQPAALLALCAAILFGFEVIFLKLLSGREPVLQILLIVNFFALCLMSIAMIWVWQTPTPTQWFFMIGTGITMVTAQVFFTNALRFGDASFVLPFSYCTLIFATLYDLALFNIVPSKLSLIGGAVVIVSGIILAWREN